MVYIITLPPISFFTNVAWSGGKFIFKRTLFKPQPATALITHEILLFLIKGYGVEDHKYIYIYIYVFSTLSIKYKNFLIKNKLFFKIWSTINFQIKIKKH